MTQPLTRQNAKLAMVLLAMTLAPMIAPTVAFSADLDPIYVEEPVVTPVEFGSGWYLRGDVGYSMHGPFDTGGTNSEDLDFVPVNASVAMGYQYNEFLRGEVEFGYLGSSSFDISDGRCSGTSTFTPIVPGPIVVNSDSVDCDGHNVGDNEMWNGLVNGYVDLGQYGGFKPYVGAGLGLVYNKYSGDSDQGSCTGTTITDATGTTVFVCDDAKSIDDKSFGFLWQVSAGFGYQLTDYTTIDVGYRYLSSPDVSQVVSKSGGIDTKEGMGVQQVRIGLRYQIW